MAKYPYEEDILSAENPTGLKGQGLKTAINGTPKAPTPEEVTGGNIRNAISQPQQVNLIDYVDSAGNTQSIRQDQVQFIPSDWKLKTATQTQQTPQQTPKGVVDNSAKIADTYEQQKAAALASLRAAIQKSKGQYQSTIESAPETFRPLKDQTTVARNEQLSRLRESMAEQGQQGGVSRSEELAVNVARENQLNALEQQQRQVVTEAQKAINDLEASGQVEEAKIVADNANNRIRALIEEANRVSSETYNRERTAIEDQRYQDKLAREDKQVADELERRRLEQERLDFAATINPAEDLTAKLNQLKAQGVPETDYRYVELNKARIQKLGNMAEREYQAELLREKDEAKRQEQAYDIAKYKFENGLPADSVTATLLGIPVGTVIPSQRIKEAQLALDKIKASKTSSGSSDKLTLNQALTQARQILGQGASAADVQRTANELMTGKVTDTGSTKQTTKTSVFEEGIKSNFEEDDTVATKREKASYYIVNQSDQGNLTDAQARELIIKFGVTESDLRKAEAGMAMARELAK